MLRFDGMIEQRYWIDTRGWERYYSNRLHHDHR